MPSQGLQEGLQEGLSASPTPRPRTHCGGVHQQIGFPDLSVATRPDPVCAAGAAVPLWDSASSRLWLGRCTRCQHLPSRSWEAGVGLSSHPFPCAHVHTGLQTLPPRHPEPFSEALRSAAARSRLSTLAGQGYRSSACEREQKRLSHTQSSGSRAASGADWMP